METTQSAPLPTAPVALTSLPPHPLNSPSDPPLRPGVLLALGAILVLAAVLRLHALAHESLWFDESLTVIHIRKPLLQMLASAHMLENMPPFYFCLMWVWARVFGTSDFSVRLPSVILGVASVAVMFDLARRLPRSPDRDRFALLAALLLTVSRYHIAYCQQARAYSLMIFLCLVSCDCFLRLIGFGRGPGQTQERPALVGIYLISSAAMLWVQPFSGFSLLAQNLFFGLLWLRSLLWPGGAAAPLSMRRWLTMQGGIMLLFGPWLWHMQEVMQIGAPWMHPPHIAQAYIDYADTRPLLALLVLLVLLALARGLWRREAWVTFALLLCALPVCVPVWASTPRHILFIPRYGMAAMIGLYLLSAGGASFLGPAGAWAAAAMVCAAAAPNLVDDFRHDRNLVPRPDVRDAAALVDRRAAAGDGLVCEEPLEQKVFSVYSTRADLNRLAQMPRESDIAGGTSEPRRIWFLAASGRLDPRGMWITATPYHVVKEWYFNDAVVAEVERP